ncbi:MAG: protein kinase [Elusimicrobia bacterium]|nr:protein kinase [Elusimicrobiota bacterium]
MNITIRSAVLLLLAVGAGASPRRSKPLTKEQVVTEALRRYQQVHDDFAKRYPKNPEWLVQLDTARDYFKEQSDGYLKQSLPYRQEELRRLQRVIEVQIRGEQATIAAYRDAARRGLSREQTTQAVMAVQQDTKEKIQIAAMPEMPQGQIPQAPIPQGQIPQAQTPQGQGLGQSLQAGVQAHAEGSVNGAAALVNPGLGGGSGNWWSTRVEWANRVEASSLVVNLGVASIECAQHSEKCAPPKPLPPIPAEPVMPLPGPSPVTPAQPLPNDPDQGEEEPPVPIVLPPNWHEDAAATASGPGATTGMITGGVLAERRGDYSLALSLAKTALSSDPANKDALALLHSVKGRGAAADSSEAGMKTASAGAAALAPSGFEAGGVGGGGPPSGLFGAAISPGASRLATEHAKSGVENALKLRDPQSALDIVNKALSQDPENPTLLNIRSHVHGHLGRWEDALKDASAGLTSAARMGAANNPALLSSLARAQNRTHRYKEALATSERLIADDPRSAWGYANRAHARGGLGDKAAMMADVEMAARLDPRFQQAAAEAAALTLPSASDVLFLFPGESGKRPAPAPAPAGRGKSFGVVVGAGIVGGLLLALGLLSTVLAPLKNTVVSVFTRAKRTGPAATPAVATAQPASAAGNVGLIRGQYEISRQIGQGGMGTVYEGTDRSLGRRVAIKKMRDELRVNARERDRFIIEAKTVASLHHPNIVDIYAIAEEGEDVYLVFEYVDGKTVHDLVQVKGRLDAAEAVRATRAMGEALT